MGTSGCCPIRRAEPIRPGQGTPDRLTILTSTPSAELVAAVVKAYDVRGLVGEQIDEPFVRAVGAAFARLVRFIALHPGDDRETARAHLVDLYTVVGTDDPRVQASRRRLAAALF